MAQTEIQTQAQPQQESPTNLSELEENTERLWQIAQSQSDNPEALLQILRVLEATHKRIRDDLFQPALPNSRHELFNLLRDIETNGGWPHIYRMKVNEICKYLEQSDDEDSLN
ncbi:MAG: hypothetical protein DCE90_15020 [Pseudanabaena sp.]|nr:MAG: hypothetical protein DCE90_15020 [Pseudanabaena sp.]